MTSLQSAPGGFGVTSPTHGAAITAGTQTNSGDILLFVNGSFSTSPSVTQTVFWGTGESAFPLQTFGGVTATQIVVNVPGELYAATVVQGTTPVAVPIQVEESDSSTESTRFSNTDVTFTINPQMGEVTLPPGRVGVPYSQNFFTGGTAPFTVAFSTPPAPPGLNATTGNPLAGTPTTAGAFSVMPFITDTWGNVFQPEETVTIQAALLSISTTSLPFAISGHAYSTTVQATGGTPAYNWSGTTGLPTGLSIAPSTGVISGTTTQVGPATVNLQVTDQSTQTANTSLTLQVYSVPSITTATLPSGTISHAYTSTTVTATGGSGAFTWSATGLPAGMSIGLNNGTISGTPTASGSFSVVVTVTDTVTSQTAQRTLPLTINSLPTISTASLPSGVVGHAYNTTVAATGGVTPYTWSATGLPAGLNINSSTGAITGTPTGPGTASATITVNDSNSQSAQTTLSLTVNSGLTITTATLPSGVVGHAYNTTVAATGGVTPYTWSATGLPAGLNINSSTGAITGTPTGPGTASATITVNDSSTQTAQATLSLTVNTGLTITTATLPSGVVGHAYNTTVTAAGGVTPYTWSATGLPAGLNINSSTGAITGTPSGPGTSSVTITVNDSSTQTAQATLSLTINTGLTITTATLPSGVAGHAYSTTVTAAGGVTPYTWSATGLPAGLNINSSTGAITGTPSGAGTSSVTITVHDSSTQTAQATLSLTVNSGLTITTASLPSGVVGHAYTTTVAATGGVTPYTWGATGLPTGLTINNRTGAISGTPGATGTFPVVVTVNDSGTQSTQATLSLTINTVLNITTTTLPNGVITRAYNATVAGTGGVTPYTWSATGLPTGLTINPTSGAIVGAPTATGTSSVVVTLRDSSSQTAQTTFSLTVSRGLTVTTTSLPSGVNGHAYNTTVAADGGVTPYTWTATGLPTGLSINATSGAITGTPAAAGTFSVVVGVRDSSTQTAQATLSLRINNSLTITTTGLASGQIGQAYTATVAATGGSTPFRWSATGLPSGLSINQASGVISGTTLTAGTFSVVVSVADSSQQTAQATFSLTIFSALTITNTSLPPATINHPYSVTLTAQGGGAVPMVVTANPTHFSTNIAPSLIWSATGLPAGLVIGATTGVISGTPTVAGTFQVAITVADSISQETAHVTLPLTVFSALNIISSSLPLAIVNRPYTCALAASGSATPFTWTVSGLPPGLTASSAGVISGTPTAAGTFTVDVTVTDSSDQTAQTSLTLAVAGVLTITTTSLPAASVGNVYGAGVSFTGGLSPYSWSATGLPAGLTIDQATGNITGAATVAGPAQVTILLSDGSDQTAQVTLPLVVNSAPPPTLQIATNALSNASVGVVYAQFVNATGGTGEYSFTTTSGSLPSGITFSTTGQLYGTPTAPGQYNFTVQVSDTQNFASRAFTLTVSPAPVTVTGAPPVSVTVGTAITTTFSATGGLQPYRFSASGDLPTGTSFDAATATLTGTATAAGTFNFTVTATDSQTPPFTAAQSFTITVNPAALQISASLPPGQVGQPYSGAFSATGGAGGYTFSGSAGDGLSISAAGAVTGLPATAQEVPVSVTVTDSSGARATASFTITIVSASLLITTSSLPNGALNSTYSANLNASGGTGPYTFAATGLPGGLTLSSGGAITGTPTALGTFTVTATVTDSTGAKSSANLSLTVTPAGLKITTTGISQPTLGQSFSVGFSATGGTPPYTWSATGLPSGVTLSSTGTLSGTLSSMTPSNINVTVTDAAGTQSTETLALSAALPAAPTLTFSGLPSNGSSGTQPSSTVTFSNTYPVPVTVNLTLTFTPANGPDDPNIQFSSGGRTTSVMVPAGATASLSSVGVQTGTVAGVITITANLVASGTDITPSPAPTRTITIAPAAPTISSVTLATTSTGLSATVIGFDPTRSITQATFTFNPAAGSTLQTSTFTVTEQSQFNAWFQSSNSAQFGSQFNFTIPFTVTGNVSGISSVTVTLTNPTGTSSSVTANL